MFDLRTLVLAVSFVLLSSGLSLGFGCGDDPPATIEFRDTSEGCNSTPDRLSQPIAEGAQLDLTVLADGREISVAESWIDDPDVLSIEGGRGRSDDPLVVRAIGPGTSGLHVEIGSGEQGTVNLSVATAASATITADPLTVWNLDTALEVRFPEATEPLTSAGYALLPGTQMVLQVELRDDQGRSLIGHGAANWSVTPELVTVEQVDPRRDDIRVTSGESAGDVVISTIADGRFEVSVVIDESADSLVVYLPESGEVDNELSVAVGETRTVVLVAFDDSGRVILGNGSSAFEATLAGSDVAAIADPPWNEPSEGDEGAEPDASELEALAAFLSGARVTYVEGVAPGETTLSLSAAGLTTELEILVTDTATP